MLCIFIILVYCKISQMNESILHRHRIETKFLCTQTGKTLLIHESLQRMEISNKNIDSHIKLITIQQQRIVDVFLNHNVVRVIELGQVTNHFDSSASRFTYRFHYPIVSILVHNLLFMKFHTKLGVFFGQVESQRQKVKGYF